MIEKESVEKARFLAGHLGGQTGGGRRGCFTRGGFRGKASDPMEERDVYPGVEK